jgi:hypothetical protein
MANRLASYQQIIRRLSERIKCSEEEVASGKVELQKIVELKVSSEIRLLSEKPIHSDNFIPGCGDS